MPMSTPFRRSVQNDTKRTGGKGRKGNFYEQLKLPTTTPTPFILINAEYVDSNPAPEELEIDPATGRAKEVKKVYYRFLEHTRQVMKNGTERFPKSVCSAGSNPHSPQPCAGCGAIDQGDRSVSPASYQTVMGVVHLALYHKHPLLDRKTGMPVMKQAYGNRPAEPMMIDNECEGRTCNFCRVQRGEAPIIDQQNPWPNYRPQDIQTFFGKRRYLKMGKNHLQALIGWDTTISSMCGNDGSQLITDGFKCPSCQSVVINMSDDTRTDGQIAEAVGKPYPCLRCQRNVILEEVVACEVCEQNNRQPAQHTMFSRVLWGMRQGEQTASTLVLHRHESLQEFFARVPAQLLGGKDVNSFLAELAKPYDFAALFAPKTLIEQMKELDLTPAQGMAPQQYGQQGGYQQPGAYPQQGGYQQAPNYGAPPAGQPQVGAPPVGPPAAPGPAAPAPMMQPNYGRPPGT